jgi:hypothetical protein
LGCGDCCSVRREICANRVTINCWYQRQCRFSGAEMISGRSSTAAAAWRQRQSRQVGQGVRMLVWSYWAVFRAECEGRTAQEREAAAGVRQGECTTTA